MNNLVKSLTKNLINAQSSIFLELFPPKLRHNVEYFLNMDFSIADMEKDIVDYILNCLETYKYKSTQTNQLLLTTQVRQGGKDAQDLTKKLTLMYRNAFAKHNINHTFTNINYSESGFFSATILIQDSSLAVLLALSQENGMHRIERYSPFNSQHKKQTSHIQVKIEQLELDPHVQIKDSDIEIQTIKASGPGGQYVNKTESGILIKYKPLNIVVKSTQFRSQSANRKFALQLLKSKVAEHQKTIIKEKTLLQKIIPPDTTIIRSYDLISNTVRNQHIRFKLKNANGVLKGNIDILLMYNILYAVRKTCN